MSLITRQHHKNLEPLKISHSAHDGRASTASLPSPSLVAARAYYLEQTTPTGQRVDAVQRRRSLFEVPRSPRRHSVLVPPETPRALAVPRRASDASSVPAPVPVPVPVPFEYTHHHLRDWGHAYLNNASTADVFVHALPLRHHPDSAHVTIRARIVPRSPSRKPFLIQRPFDLDHLRASIPPAASPPAEEPPLPLSPPPLRRSPRARPAIPIHIEYALHYLPALAALMLSGHVHRGDAIDLPMPHPELWADVVRFVYTGHGALSDGIVKDIRFLAGRV